VTVVRFDAVVLAWAGMEEMVGFHQVLWLVMLESAKDQILRVNPQDNMCRHMSGMEQLAY
jgi:hypothetical protein